MSAERGEVNAQQPMERLGQLPLPESMGFQCVFPRGENINVKTHGAIKVNVRANVQEIRKIDIVQETFTAIFVLDFHWVDRALRDFQTKVCYWDDQGCRCEEIGRIIGNLGYNNEADVVIETHGGNVKHILPTSSISMSQPDWLEHGRGEFFYPDWTMMNVVGTAERLAHQCKLEFCSDAGGHVKEKYTFMASFSERFEFHDMPFDRQLLRMKFVAEVPHYRLQFAPVQRDAGELKGGGRRADVPDQLPAT
mmetsp:Transcript_167974/g.534234  ORF Transcript_167974/g.534234 Transcript_167974/m.534234 type:complete len:251 (-) Transcript_167974:15-767(-)